MDQPPQLSFLLPRLRLQFARLGLPGVQAPTDERLAAWLASLPLPATVDEASPVDFGVSVTADRRRLTGRATGYPAAVLPGMLRYLGDVGAAAEELERFDRARARVQPARLGSWLEVTDASQDAGWSFPVDLPLVLARELADAGPANDRLGEWAGQHGVTQCTCLRRSVAVGNPFAELRLTLPDADVERQVYAGVKLFERLGVPALPDVALGALLNLEQQGLAISVSLTAMGVARLGLLAARPSTRLMLELCRAVGLDEYDDLAAFQGLLGVDGPAYAECQRRADGVGVDLHYDVPGDLDTIEQ